MSRGLPEERVQDLESADRLARERLAPLAPRMDAEEWWPDEAFRALGKEGHHSSGLSTLAHAFRRWTGPVPERTDAHTGCEDEARPGAELREADART